MTDRIGKTVLVGLGAMGLGMARSLRRAGIATTGVDLAAERRAALGDPVSDSAATAAEGADLLILVVVNAAQVEAILFGPQGCADRLAPGAAVMVSSTVPPTYARTLGDRLAEKGLLHLDAPISGGEAKAEAGAITVMGAGSEAAFAKCEPALQAMAETVFRLGEESGSGSAVKVINQLLTGVHLCAAAEAMTLAARLGLDLQQVYEVITRSAGNSWMFENRMPRLIEGDTRPRSAIEIFVKDLGIVVDTAREQRYPVPLAAGALQQYLAAAGSGLGQLDDSTVARVYAALSGVTLPGMEEPPAGGR